MNADLAPSTLDELVEAVRSVPRVIPVGGRTKPRLTQAAATPISTLRLSGMVDYEPSEFTFTALAGTPVREIARTLAERGQYLPFDPMLSEAGATLGGTIASGLSGPGRFRFGGLRDFILGVRFVDGAGRLLRMGGKVVKNAAGFDLPKFFVGSLGRWGILAEVTFKVFPRPEASRTIALQVDHLQAATQFIRQTSVNRWELGALDVLPGGQRIALRLGGPERALDPLAQEILGRWTGNLLSIPDADDLWSNLNEFRWAHPEGYLLKVPLCPDQMPALFDALQPVGDVRIHFSAGGNVAYVSLPGETSAVLMEKGIRGLGHTALTLRGRCPLALGRHTPTGVEAALRLSLDPLNRFPPMDD